VAVGSFHANCGLILAELEQALGAVDESQVEELVDAILGAEKVFAVGLGRVFLSMQAVVKRLNHLGVRAWCVGEINEPAITEKDLLLVGSGTGESAVPVAMARAAKRYSARVAHIGSNPTSSLSPFTDIFVRIPVQTRLSLPGETPSRQIMTSLFEQSLLLLGDAVALIIAERKGITDMKSLWRLHANLE
jgi:6-phospho-3-hexuloisomerase